MLQVLYASRLRSWARALGITWLLQMPRRIRGRKLAARWDSHRGDTLAVDIAGVTVVCPASDKAEFLRAVYLAEDAQILETIAGACGTGAVYWDVGANLGHYAAILSKVVGAEGKVFAFEPEPRVRDQLHACVGLNGDANVTVVPLGLSDRTGRLDFFADTESASGTHSLIAHGPGSEKITVDVTTGDDFVASGNPCPTVMKIDVEGAELSVVRGMPETLKNPALAAVLCEVHFAVLERSGQGEAPAEIARLLRDAGLTDQRWVDASHLFARRAA